MTEHHVAWFRNTSGLTHAQYALMTVLVPFSDDNGVCEITPSEMTGHIRWSERYVRKILAQLRDRGLIRTNPVQILAS
jgi:DNA-binding IscR family transcriptional regulator